MSLPSPTKAVSFRFSPEDVELLERARVRAGAKTQAEALRTALRFYAGENASPIDAPLREFIQAFVRQEVGRQIKADRSRPASSARASERPGSAR